MLMDNVLVKEKYSIRSAYIIEVKSSNFIITRDESVLG